MITLRDRSDVMLSFDYNRLESCETSKAEQTKLNLVDWDLQGYLKN